VSGPDPEMKVFVTVERARRTLLICGGVVGVAMAILIGVAVWQFVQLRQAGDALCTFRGDLEARVHDSETFLRRHPAGLPGIASREEILRDIASRRRTVDSLRRLKCPIEPAPGR
jgi:hypothetical protein